MAIDEQPLSPKANLNQAIDLINSGQIGAAMRICRDALKKEPDDVNMTALLGAMLLKSREMGLSEKYLRRAIELAPNFAKPHEDLGFLLYETGRPTDAVEVLETATRLDPQSEPAFYTLGRALAAIGKGTESDDAFEASFELNPQRKQLALAAEHHKAGRTEEAERAYRDLLRDDPNNVDALRLLAGIAVNRNDIDEAEPLLRKAIASAPDFYLALLDLGGILHEQHRYAEAIRCFERAVELEPNSSRSHFMLASTRAPAGQTYKALDSYRRVLELKPQHAGAWLGLGHTLKTVGHQSEAIDAYRESITSRPNNGESYWSLANLKTYELTRDDIEAMESSLEDNEGLTDQSAVNFLFALAKVNEDRGRFDQAWNYFQQGNSKQRSMEHYDPVQTEVSNDEIIQTFDDVFVQTNTGLGDPSVAPIFIVGLPRSGSTLIEQILASHSMVEGTSELPYIGRVATSLNRNRADGVNYPFATRELREPNFRALGQDYLNQASAHRQTDKPRFIDKNPNNFPSIGLIHLVLPNAKIIDARRYPLDSTLSCYRQLFAKGQTFVYDLIEIGEYFLQYQRMMDHWHQVLPDRVLTVQYEDVVTDLEGQVRRLLAYCELPWEEACVRFHETERPIRTASSEQVRQPIYSKSIHFWRNYEAHLGELIDVLKPVLPNYKQYESINQDGSTSSAV